MRENIFPIKEGMLVKSDKEALLKQKGYVLWMFGLSGSGKSTLAKALENELYAKGFHTKLLDGDNLRVGVNNNLGFSEEDRVENIRRASEVAKLFAENGEIVVCSLISPTVEIREMAKKIIGEDQFLEIYVNCPFEVCAERDVKGLYKRALNGEIPNFTGLDAPFEGAENPFLELRTDLHSLEECKNELLNKVLDKVTL